MAADGAGRRFYFRFEQGRQRQDYAIQGAGGTPGPPVGCATAKNRVQTETKQESKDRPQRPPSTITVGTLLNESERRRNAAAQQNDSDTTGERHVDAVDMMIPLEISTRPAIST